MVAQKPISVGDSVSLTYGTTSIQGVVVDDRGPIGANSVRIFTIRIPNDPYDDEVFEMPEDELALTKESVEPIPVAEIIDYLGHGGLTQILKSNKHEDKNQLRVWLKRDSLGNVVHTFVAGRGSVGGAVVPTSSLQDNQISKGHLKNVLTFLSEFGLSKNEAKRVVDTAGVAP